MNETNGKSNQYGKNEKINRTEPLVLSMLYINKHIPTEAARIRSGLVFLCELHISCRSFLVCCSSLVWNFHPITRRNLFCSHHFSICSFLSFDRLSCPFSFIWAFVLCLYRLPHFLLAYHCEATKLMMTMAWYAQVLARK